MLTNFIVFTEHLPCNLAHNICVWLSVNPSKPKEQQFAPITEYIKNSSLFFAVSENVDIYERIIREFWRTAKVIRTENDLSIAAKIDEHEVIISEEVIRQMLKLDDEGGIERLDSEYVMKNFKRLGYQGDINRKSIKKSLLCGTWRYLLHMGIQCLGGRKGGFDEANMTLASGVLAFIQGKKFNWSQLILQNMRYNLEEGSVRHKHLQYPRFLQIILNDLLKDKVINKGTNKLKLQHMTKSVYANCLSQNKRSGVEIIEVALFGPIIGQTFVEEEEQEEEEEEEQEEEQEEGILTIISEEPAQELPEATTQEPVIEPSIEETENVFEEIEREEAQQLAILTTQGIERTLFLLYKHCYSCN